MSDLRSRLNARRDIPRPVPPNPRQGPPSRSPSKPPRNAGLPTSPPTPTPPSTTNRWKQHRHNLLGRRLPRVRRQLDVVVLELALLELDPVLVLGARRLPARLHGGLLQRGRTQRRQHVQLRKVQQTAQRRQVLPSPSPPGNAVRPP
uniref:(northern house mosquito) hypothetical protein n=1 Tax=Culex pipiens TaxID=7175 RepID=A0A8D8FES3_CULPI